MHVNLPEGGQGGGYAVQFVLKSGAFFLELANYRLHQCFWHRSILALGIRRPDLNGGGRRRGVPGPLERAEVRGQIAEVKIQKL